MLLRPSRDTDIAAITAIYSHYVEHSTSTFETMSPAVDEMRRRRAEILSRGLPYLVMEVDGVVAGYAYATMYRPRGAYRFTVEDSIYIHRDFGRRGIGRVLLQAVIEECERQDYRQMVAVIGGSDNQASIALHGALGFQPAGLLRSAGYKFDRWVDSVLMQRELGAGANARPLESIKSAEP